MKNGNSTFSAADCIENLRNAGFSPEQAHAQAKEIERSRNDMMAVLATKEDIEQLRKDTQRDIKNLDLRIANVEKEIADVRKEIADVRKEVADVRKEVAEIRKEIGDLAKYIGNQNLKTIGVLGVLIAILKFLPDFFN